MPSLNEGSSSSAAFKCSQCGAETWTVTIIDGIYYCSSCAEPKLKGQDPPSRSVPYKCPVCNGTGWVSFPPGIAGDIGRWSDSGTGPWQCQPCSGTGILWGM